MPIISIAPASVTFDANGLPPGYDITATTTNATDTSYTFILKDQTIAGMETLTPAGSGTTGATTPFYLGEDDAPNSKTLVAKSVQIEAVAVPLKIHTTTLIVVGNDTGATSSITITNNYVV